MKIVLIAIFALCCIVAIENLKAILGKNKVSSANLRSETKGFFLCLKLTEPGDENNDV